ARLSGQDDISVGIPIAGRTRAEVEGLIGFFVNALVIRTRLQGPPSFRELIQRVREASLGAYAHQDVPFDMVVEALQPERSLSRMPLVQVMFTLLSEGLGRVELSGLRVEEQKIGAQAGLAKFDLALSVIEGATELVGRLDYSTELFEAGENERMGRELVRVLEGAVADRERSLGEIEILTAAEREQLLVTWNRTEVEYGNQTVVEMFEEQAARQPDALAVVGRGEKLSYGELNSRANQLARYLQERGVGPEVKVGVCVERSVGLVVGIMGIVKAGGTYVPMDPDYPGERLSYMVKDAGIKILLAGEQERKGLGGLEAEVSYLDIEKEGEWQAVGRHSGGNLERVVEAGNLAYVIYTSGTTGQPKGVEISHGGLGNLVK